MIIWEGFNNLINVMNSYGSNDYASVTLILVVGALIYDKVAEPLMLKLVAIVQLAVSDWKTGRQLRKSKEAAR